MNVPIDPQAFGELILVPFISWHPLRVQFGTEAMAPPGALIHTPRAPSGLGRKSRFINVNLHEEAPSQHHNNFTYSCIIKEQ